jgi:membrane-associated phospholipid phosphatase
MVTRNRLAWAGLAAYLALSAVAFLKWGLLWGHDWIWIWLLVGLLAVSLADLRGWLHGMLRDWLPFMALILAYNLLRGISDGLVHDAHSRFQIDADRFLFAGHLPTIDLQRALFPLHSPLRWYDYATWSVYTTHFVVTVVVAAVLWRVNRERFRQFRNRVVALAFAGIATFAVYPTVPPWLADERGLIPHVARISMHVAHHVGIQQVGAIFERGSHFANLVAAVPSLHAAFPMLILLFFWGTARPAVRAVLAAYVLGMGFAVVYSGEHYVFDVLVGWAYAAGTAALVEAPVWSWLAARAPALPRLRRARA